VTADLVKAAHAAGLKVHPWTFRAENYFLPVRRWSGVNPRGRGDLRGEIDAFLAMGVDGIFSDFPGIAAQAVGKPPAKE
jgi:glycerophosphoryl diester phosphodiesterase